MILADTYRLNPGKKITTRLLFILLAALVLLSSTGLAAANDPTAHPAVEGMLDFSSYDFQHKAPVRLDGEWEFIWSSLLEPGDPAWSKQEGIRGFYPVPLFWTSYKGLNLPSDGFCTYRLRIKTSGKCRNFGIKTPEIFTEYRLWVNGELIDQRGTFDEDIVRFMRPSVFTFHTKSDITELVLQIKNRSHQNAGIGQSFIFGNAQQVYRNHILSVSMEIMLIAICIFAGLYHSIIYIFRKEEKELLYFGLFCIIMAVRTFLTGNTLITQAIPDLSFEAGSRIATSVIPLSVISFHAFAYYFFREITPRRIFLFLLTVQFAYLAIVFTTPTMFYTTVYTYYLAAILASCLFIIGINIYAIIKNIKYSVIFISGFMFVFTGVANDVLHYMQVINTGYYLAFFFSAFILTEALMLAIKFSQEHRIVSELSERLKVLDRLKDEFLANTSHELRTPLNGIIGITESLIDGATGPLPEKTVYNLKLIVSSGRRLYNLINDILDFSKIKNNDISLNMKRLDIKQIVNVVISVFKAAIPGKEIELINEIQDNIPFVRGDENRLQQILYNLIGNAVKFTSSGCIRVSSEQEGDFVRIKIKDTGIGIASGRLDAIFTSFEQADGSISREYGGTGLGLPITKKLVELHGGVIDVESVPGEGSCFSFTLPVSIADTSTFNHKESPVLLDEHIKNGIDVPSPVNNNKNSAFKGKILIVDDESVNVQVLLNHLSIKNYRTDFASNGFEAMEKLNKNSYDLILLDLMMPRMSGYEVCRSIRENFTSFELPVIILTAKDRPQDIIAAFDSGANDYLVKPIDRTELFARIDTHLTLKKAVNAAIENAELANTDQLTGLYNRRYFIQAGTRELETAKRYSKDLSVIMLDIDNFKQVNDTFGHETGDIFIKKLSSILAANVRGVDIPGRFGGDEFIIILPETGSSGASIVAEKIRSIIENEMFNDIGAGDFRFTISAGISSYSKETESFDAMMKEADEMLYISKKAGRNRVTVFK